MVMPHRQEITVEPAAIRYKNPGAMWGRTGSRPSSDKVVPTNAKIPVKWGSTETVYLSDGTGQGNNIAVFGTWLQGICAQLDLWRTDKKYKNKRFADAIRTWSGGNNVPSYIAYCKKRVPGLTDDTIMNDAFWSSPSGIAFLKAQSAHEAGKAIPAPATDWIEAQRIVFSGAAPVKLTPIVTSLPSVDTVAAPASFDSPGTLATLWRCAARTPRSFPAVTSSVRAWLRMATPRSTTSRRCYRVRAIPRSGSRKA
jgi:hypothetical protein